MTATNQNVECNATSLAVLCCENDVPIHYEDRDDDAPVNLTDMWRAKGSDTLKRPGQWLRLPDTKEFVSAFIELTPMCAVRTSAKNPVGRAKDAKLIYTRKGGKNSGGGTWAHNEIAIEYARWLDKRLAVKINRIFKQVMLREIERLRECSQSLRVQYELFDNIEHFTPRDKVRGLISAHSGPRKSMQALCRHLYQQTGFDPYVVHAEIKEKGGRATMLGIIEAHGFIEDALEIVCRMLNPASTPATLRQQLDVQ